MSEYKTIMNIQLGIDPRSVVVDFPLSDEQLNKLLLYGNCQDQQEAFRILLKDVFANLDGLKRLTTEGNGKGLN